MMRRRGWGSGRQQRTNDRRRSAGGAIIILTLRAGVAAELERSSGAFPPLPDLHDPQNETASLEGRQVRQKKKKKRIPLKNGAGKKWTRQAVKSETNFIRVSRGRFAREKGEGLRIGVYFTTFTGAEEEMPPAVS